LHDHIEWANFVNSIEYEEWMGRVLFNIPINVNLAFKYLNGLLIDPHKFRSYCLKCMNIIIYYWMMAKVCHITLEYLLVLIVDVWTSKFVNWFNLLVEAMNNLMITIVENLYIHYNIILLVILDINCLRLKLYDVEKLTYFLLHFLTWFICCFC
jgi:hypothetical protein